MPDEPPAVPACPYCDCRRSTEPDGPARYFCKGCGRTFVMVTERDYRRLINPDEPAED